MIENRVADTKSLVERSLNELRGLLIGVKADNALTSDESAALRVWLDSHEEIRGTPPFLEIATKLDATLLDGQIATDELEDLVWLIDQIADVEGYFKALAPVAQELRGILIGISADGVVSDAELRRLRVWLEDHAGLRKFWPFTEIDSLVTATLADGRIDEKEQDLLLRFFARFGCSEERGYGSAPASPVTLPGICAVDPEIVFAARRFCFTGESPRGARDVLENEVRARGGSVSRSVTKDLDYLVVGALGSDYWAFSCYGRKVELAMKYRQQSRPVVIVHENDFWDAAAG